ncbi:MAG TPA: 50S ribosomal protein L11 methyltransferase [Catalimonadaceae bacterium]|nr:50S ribosomal protein L11 methyltransferase [Catalimonadaceae bacterium]
MHFIQLTARCAIDLSDILIAELAELGFDSFEENPKGFSAYVEEEKMDFLETKSLMERYSEIGPLSYGLQKIERQNWNQEWESNFPPIVVDNQILVKAPFHKLDENYPVVITIVPKMSFGTGHHATTSQMLRFLLKFPPTGKRVLDAGSGTGILAIMAEKMGATDITAFDNDPWCIENSKENFELNSCRKCKVHLASTAAGYTENFDVILANINKNVLLAEIENYANILNPKGKLFLSGFYEEDIPDLESKCNQSQLSLIDQSAHDNWACLVFSKSPTH